MNKKNIITKRDMFEKSFERPTDFFKLSLEDQWEIDKKLGILDWCGDDLTDEDIKKYNNHYDNRRK